MVSLRRPARGQAGRGIALVLSALVLGAVLLFKFEGEWLSAGGATLSVVQQQPTHAQLGASDGSDGIGGGSGSGLATLAPPQPPPPAPRLELTDAMKMRCRGTLGTWCTDFHTQPPVPAVTAPRGNKTCSLDCNKVGTCSALTGLCTCPAGWTGFNCLHPMKRFCTHKFRQWGFEVERVEPDLSVGVGEDKFWLLPHMRCAGACDEDIAACFCPANTTYGRIPALPEAPLGTPPIQRGRPLSMWCQPNKTQDGQATSWGTIDPVELFGPEGWCNAEKPAKQCNCYLDGYGGPQCELVYQQVCLNQCNGRGDCQLGYCKCHPGWHGIDCAHRSTAADAKQPGLDQLQPWVGANVRTPAASEFEPGATRKRPLIYVYDLPSDYATLMLQYRHGGEDCTSRYYNGDNDTILSAWTYALEPGLLEMMLQSEHRTLDPEEADYFYVPVFPSCYMQPVRQSADSLRDFFYGHATRRPHGATNMLLEAYHWLRAHHPYWDRRGGRDHIWLVTHDEASCYVPAAIRSSIILSHWGRKDANHTSDTGYWEDVYSKEHTHPHWEPDGFLHKIQGHPCYDPAKDLIVPLMKRPDHYHLSPLIGAPTRERTWLAFHRGRVQHGNPPYSRGIRQRLANASRDGDWQENYKIVVGEHDQVGGDYSQLLASSIFCLVLPGDGWSARMDDATLHGCIPVIIMDNVDVSFETIVDLAAFTIRIPQADAGRLPQILLAVSEERRQEMRAALARVWQRFAYSSYLPYSKRFKDLAQENAECAAEAAAAETPSGGGGGEPLSLPATVTDLDPTVDDAFGTIMAWLYGRLEATR